MAPSISQRFNFSLDHGKLPSVWKSVNVVPIHKSGERTLAENYRPVSLTRILVKCLERIIHKHIMKFLTHHGLLSESQHGFREARSCVTQLLQLLHSWYSSLEKGDSVEVIFLDFAKAFDKVSHHHLLYKFSVMAFGVICFPGFVTICQTVHKESLLEVIHQKGWRCPLVSLKGVY